MSHNAKIFLQTVEWYVCYLIRTSLFRKWTHYNIISFIQGLSDAVTPKCL